MGKVEEIRGGDPRFLQIERRNGLYHAEGQFFFSTGHKLPTSSRKKEEDGIYAEWHWDGVTLKVQNDRYGLYPLYYYNHNGQFGLSCSLVTLLKLGAPTQLNYSGLAVFVRLGFFLNEQTPFEGIKAVPPGTILEWRDGQVRITSQKPAVSAKDLSRADAIDAYISLFQQAIRRRLPSDENFAVLLSGGRDSRHIFLELLSAGFKPKFALTVRCMPPKSNSDVEIASRICEETNISQVVLDHADNVFLRRQEKTYLQISAHQSTHG